jgi:trimethylamine:corrinoid methyltransferase-like protein
LLEEQHLLISKHTREHLRHEHYMPGPSIDRANRSRWREEGSKTLGERAHSEVERLVAQYTPSTLSDETKRDLTKLMAAEARRYGMDTLPHEQL